MTLGEMFRSDVTTAGPEESIRDVAARMKRKNIGAVVVVEGRRVVGIATDRDVALAVALGKASPDAPVSTIMTREVKSVWDDQGLFNATQAFMGYRVRRLPIVNHDNELVGIVTVDDVFALLAQELSNVSKALAPALPHEESVLEPLRS
jgi:CBS domain-containing protein